MPLTRQTLPKQERLCHRSAIDCLFSGGKGKSMTAFPVRMVYCTTSRPVNMAEAQVLVSVSKRHFKHAVDRNRVKRQLREAYRKNKHIMQRYPLDADKTLLMSLIWMDSRHHTTEEIEHRVKGLIERVCERICNPPIATPADADK